MPGAVRHLLVDARPVDHPTARSRGIGRYVTGLLGGLAEIDAPFTALVGSPDELDLLADVVGPERLRPWSPSAVSDVAEPGVWYLATQLMLHPVSLDPIPRAVTAARLPVAAVMYDVIPYRQPDMYQVDPPARRLAQVRAPLARTVDAMMAISEFTADTAAHELGFPRSRIAMVGAGVDEIFVPPTVRWLDRPARVLPPDVGRYVVSVGGGDERKNTHRLLLAWAALPPELRVGHHLVIVGAHGTALLRQWTQQAADAGVTGEVVFTGAVDDDELVALLQHARLSVMASTDEGFGLPVVEAAACGCAAICSDVSSLPELLDEPAACFDPLDPAAIAAAITRGLMDDEHRGVLLAAAERAAARWRWSGVATDTMAALGALGPRWAGSPRPVRPVVAVAGPVAGSGGRGLDALVDAFESVATEMDVARHPRFVRLVDDSGTSEPVAAGADRWPVGALGRYVKPWDLSHVVALLGGGQGGDAATRRLARRHPTHVWLADDAAVGPEALSPDELASVLSRARSAIVDGRDAADAVGSHAPAGLPILVLDSDGGGHDATARWRTVLDAVLDHTGHAGPASGTPSHPRPARTPL